MRLCQEAIERGVFAQGIRPPTVPAGTSRLRLTAMASHTATELRMAARDLGRCGTSPRPRSRRDEAGRLRAGARRSRNWRPPSPDSERISRRTPSQQPVSLPSPATEHPVLAPFDFEREVSGVSTA